MKHSLKCWPEYFKAVKSGAKSFEIRKVDRPFSVDDELELHEYDPLTKDYSGETILCNVERIWHDVPGLAGGCCVMAIRVTYIGEV